MKRVLLVACVMTLSMSIYAQASGGQIRRVSNVTSSRSDKSKVQHSSLRKKTYTAEDLYDIGSSYYDKGEYAEAIKWYKKAADLGYLDAQSELGQIYFRGEGVAINHTEALNWLRKAANRGDALSQYTLGYMYSNGLGVVRNYIEAKRLFEEAAPRYYEAARSIMNTNGEEAINLFETVVSMKVSPYKVWSTFHIGEIYYYAIGGVSTDYTKAFYYFSQAGDKGNKPALYYMGLCYENGRGVQRDYTISRKLYKASGYTSLPSRNF